MRSWLGPLSKCDTTPHVTVPVCGLFFIGYVDMHPGVPLYFSLVIS
jgi:hypothetical protein